MKVEYVELKDPNSDGIRQFHDDVLVFAFPDRYGREDVPILRRNVEKGSWASDGEVCKYHLIVARWDEQIIGGVSFYFFSFGNYALGMGSYLAVKREFSHNGIGTKLIEIRDRTLLSDALASNCYLKGLIIQVNDPNLMSPEEIRQDPVDPWKREQFWNRRGYKKIGFNFIQPSIREGEPPVEYLSLFMFPYCSSWKDLKQISRSELTDIIYCFIRCTGTVGPAETDPAYVRMRSELGKQEYFRIF